MELYEILFLIGFIGTILISLVKLINILNGWSVYDVKDGIIWYVGFIISWGTMFITTILYTSGTVLILMQLFKFANLFFGLNTIFTLVEVFISYVAAGQSTQRKAYNAKETLNFKV